MEHFLILISGYIIAYLLGSISTAVWIGKWFYGVDVRNEGSKNAGATNTFRVLGGKAGLAVLLLDVAKAWGAVQIGECLAEGILEGNTFTVYQITVGLVAVLGHIFPIFTRFKGGKGVASLVGVIIAVFPYVFLIVIFILFITILLTTHYVSLASIITALMFPVLVWILRHENFTWLLFKDDITISLQVFAILIAVFIPITHHKNIRRLLKHEETKTYLFKKK